PQRRAHHDLVEDGGRRIDDELAPAPRSHDPAQVSRIDRLDLDLALLAEEAPRSLGLAIPAPNGVPLSLQQVCQQGAAGSRAQYEDPHPRETLSPPFRQPLARHLPIALNRAQA